MVLIAAVAASLCASVVHANFVGEVGKTYMRDLGYVPEPRDSTPDWASFDQGSAIAPAIEPDSTSQIWGTVAPGSQDQPLCKYEDGTCKTDISWLHSAVGIEKDFFDDDMVNYIIRFHLNAACYRSTQSSYNNVAQYCAPWYLDVGKDKKISTGEICWTWEWVTGYTAEGQTLWKKNGCLHVAPIPNAVPVPPVANRTAPGFEATAPGPAAARRMLLDSLAPASAGDTTPAGAAPESTSSTDPSNAPAPDPSPVPDVPDPESVPPPAPAPAPIFESLDDIIVLNETYTNTGREFPTMHTAWYGCKSGAATGTPLNGEERTTCENDVAGLTFGMDVETIRTLLQLIQNETRGAGGANCRGRFDDQTAVFQMSAAGAKDFCEVDISTDARAALVAVHGFLGTPEEPASVQPVVFPPPPPPPGVPPTPPLPPPPPPPPPIPGSIGQNVANPFDQSPSAGNAGASSGARAVAVSSALPLLAAALLCAA